MDLKIRGKKALVMGASMGLGRGVAEALVKEGAQVAICARTPATLEKTQKEIGAALAVPADLSKKGACRDVVRRLLDQWGGLDILVINTGGPAKGPFESITDEQWQEGFQSLWMSTVDSIKAVLPSMRKQKWGRILTITSLAAREPIKDLTVSNGLRSGLHGLIKSIANEVAGDGVTVNAILPGYTDTERLRELGVSTDKITAQIPAGRLASTQEFGAYAAFMASEQAAYITGQALLIDGGFNRGF